MGSHLHPTAKNRERKWLYWKGNGEAVSKERLLSESVIIRHSATAKNTGWCSEGAGKRCGQLSLLPLLLLSNFLPVPSIGKPYPMPAGRETRVMPSAEIWLLGHGSGKRRREYPGSERRMTSTGGCHINSLESMTRGQVYKNRWF